MPISIFHVVHERVVLTLHFKSSQMLSTDILLPRLLSGLKEHISIHITYAMHALYVLNWATIIVFYVKATSFAI